MLGTVFTAVVALLVVGAIARSARQARRAEYIRSFTLPPGLYAKLLARRPGLAPKDQQLVARALRSFFLANLSARGKLVSMPSQIVDDLWHELILYTRWYEVFCRKAFGRFLHHTPAVVLSPAQRDGNAGLRRAFWFTCREENIDPRKPTRLPLLFAIDAKLGVANGFRYALDCGALRRTDGTSITYCASDFASSDVDGSTDGFGDAGGGGDGGGDGGGGCGGGGD